MQKRKYSVPGFQMVECPRAIITPMAFELVQLVAASEQVKDASGAAFHGTDSSKWPAQFFDAVKAIQIENIRVQNEEFHFRETCK